MKILQLNLSNFRNYKNIQLNPNNINIIIGKNASGKTNILESIHFLTEGKSFRTNSDEELIKFNENQSIISSKIENFSYEDELKVIINKNGKNNFFINSEEFQLKNYRRDFSSVIFSPSDLNMIKFGPSDRRKYLDILISKVDPMYLYNLNRYKKILNDRNKLLKKNVIYELLEVYNFQLANYGVKILRMRLNILRKFEKYVQNHYKNLSGGDDLKITYLSTVPLDKEELEMESSFEKHLKKFNERDLEVRFTTVGPHRDDLDFKINGNSAKSFGSQGEIRTVVLALKLSEIDILNEIKKTTPILLLDDVFSELDENRISYLMNSINGAQTFITSTNINENKFKYLNANFYEINNGEFIS